MAAGCEDITIIQTLSVMDSVGRQPKQHNSATPLWRRVSKGEITIEGVKGRTKSECREMRAIPSAPMVDWWYVLRWVTKKWVRRRREQGRETSKTFGQRSYIVVGVDSVRVLTECLASKTDSGDIGFLQSDASMT